MVKLVFKTYNFYYLIVVLVEKIMSWIFRLIPCLYYIMELLVKTIREAGRIQMRISSTINIWQDSKYATGI